MAFIPTGAVLAHFHAPHNAGSFPAGAPNLLEGRAGAVRHGREIVFQLRVTPDDRIAECRYRVYGCPATIALCSLASEQLNGLSLANAGDWRGMALADALGLPAEKRAAVLLLEDAIHAAVRRYNKQANQGNRG